MKIYINNFNLNLIDYLDDILKDYLYETHHYIELYTDQGIFNVDNKNIKLLIPKDKPIIKYEKYFKDYTLIVDKSYFVEEKYDSVNGINYLSLNTIKKRFKIDKSSTLSLVIKYHCENSKSIPYDIYFEIDKEMDINDIFIKNELIEFLSVLN
jgi:hypothetical protein